MAFLDAVDAASDEGFLATVRKVLHEGWVDGHGGVVGWVRRLVGGLAKLGENSKGGFRVKEGDEFIGGPFERDFVDEPCALLFGLGELAGDVGGGEGDMMNTAGGVFFEKLGDRAIFRSGFQKLEVNISSSKKGGADFLGFDFFAPFTDESEDVFVVRDGFFERSDGNAKVVDFSDHRVGRGLRWTGSSQNFQNQHRRESFRLCVFYLNRAGLRNDGGHTDGQGGNWCEFQEISRELPFSDCLGWSSRDDQGRWRIWQTRHLN